MVILGAVLIAAALGLFLYNQQEENQAAESANALMPQIVDSINERRSEASVAEPTAAPMPAPYDSTEPVAQEMTVVEIDGYGYIGFIAIPSLNLELPVMADWSYPRLKISPCRYTGNLYSDDLVIMAHNYKRHFGGLSKLRTGDTITFTDMDGNMTTYEVAAVDILEPTAIEEMSSGDYDLTLFTCTYGGKSRVTVRCDRVEN